MSIQIIGMPISYGADKPGCDLGPKKLREVGMVSMLKQLGYAVDDLGDIEVAKVSDEHKYDYDSKLKYFDVVADANIKLAYKAYKSISKGNFPLTIGGDHSLAMGSIAGISKKVKKLGVVWIDAHGDLNTHETTLSGNIHGMPLAASIGKGPEKLINLFENRIKVMDENVVHIGGRDLDPGEMEILKHSKIKAFPMDNVRKYGVDMVIMESILYLKNKVDGIHVSFDLDAIDSAYIKGIGTPVPNGLTIEDAEKILCAFAASGMMVSLDFVELNPLLDEGNQTADIALELLKGVFHSLKFSVYSSLSMLG